MIIYLCKINGRGYFREMTFVLLYRFERCLSDDWALRLDMKIELGGGVNEKWICELNKKYIQKSLLYSLVIECMKSINWLLIGRFRRMFLRQKDIWGIGLCLSG